MAMGVVATQWINSTSFVAFPGEADIKGATTFIAADATGATAEVNFKKRPFGILRYSPGVDRKNAMVMEIIAKSKYPGCGKLSLQESRADGLSSRPIVKRLQVSCWHKSWTSVMMGSWANVHHSNSRCRMQRQAAPKADGTSDYEDAFRARLREVKTKQLADKQELKQQQQEQE